MQRRRLLSAAAAGVVPLAGCGRLSTDTTAATPKSTDPEPTPTPTRTTTSPTDEAGISIEVDTARYLVRSFAQTTADRAIDTEEVTSLERLCGSIRTALRAAIDGVFRADDVSDDLLHGIDRFRHNGGGYRFTPYVSADGTVYAFEPNVPVFTAHLEFDVDDPPADRTVGHDELESLAEPVRNFVRTIGAFTVQVPRDTYRISVVPPAVERFLERYDYVRDPDGVGRIVTERIDPGPPYTITATELSRAVLWGRPILEASALDADLRAFVEAVVASDRRTPALRPGRTEYRTDTIPDAYADTLTPAHGPGEGPYVDLDGTLYAFRVTTPNRGAMPVAVEVEPTGSRAFTMTVTPDSSGMKPEIVPPLELSAVGALPSVLWIQTEAGRVRLESEAYGELRWREPDGDGSPFLIDTVRAELYPEDSVSATYRVPDDVPDGTYRALGLFEAQWTRASDGRRFPQLPYPFQVLLDIHRK